VVEQEADPGDPDRKRDQEGEELASQSGSRVGYPHDDHQLHDDDGRECDDGDRFPTAAPRRVRSNLFHSSPQRSPARVCAKRYTRMSARITCAALWPAQPITLPAGWQPAPPAYTPSTPTRYGIRSANATALSTWSMLPWTIPKWPSISGGVSACTSSTSGPRPGAYSSANAI